MNGLPYYKAYPRDFIDGTAGMRLELKGAYRVVLDLIYMHGGRLPDDARYIAGQLGCSVRMWNSLRAELVALAKLVARDGALFNFRADKELESLRKFSANQAEKASKPRKINTLQQPRHSHTDTDTDTEEEASAPSSVAAPTKQPRKSVPPENWCPTHEQVAYGIEKGLSEDEVYEQAERFRDWHQSERKTRNPAGNYNAAWQTWCRVAVDRRRTQPRGNGGSGSRGGGGIVGAAMRSEFARRQGLAKGDGRDRDDPDNGGFGFLRLVGGQVAGVGCA